MKVVITGGAGYIGSVAAHRLVHRGEEVVVVDDLSQGHRAAVSPDATLEIADICDRVGLRCLFRRYYPDAVLHFAARTIAPESVREPAPYWRVNTGGTVEVLDAMRDVGTRVIVFSSTAAVYGTTDQSPISESSPTEPINPYGASKLAAERAVADFAAAHGVRHAALRYFNVGGAVGMVGEDHRPETHLVPSALDAVTGKRGPLSIFGDDFPTSDGTAIRDYVHVADLVDAHLLALDLLLSQESSLGAINLGTRDGATVLQVLSTVERVTGKPVPTIPAARREGDPARLIADCTRAAEILHWRPRRSSLDEIVSSAWEWRQRFPNGYPD